MRTPEQIRAAKRRWNNSEKGKACDARRKSSAKYLAWRKEYERSAKVVAYRKAYKARAERLAIERELAKRPHRRESHRKSDSAKLATIEGKLQNSMSCRMRAAISKRGIKSTSLVDYTMEDLKIHLEKQFLLGMTWDNYGDGWHVDHIVPVSGFSFTSVHDAEFKACWSLGNLRPLWAQDNRAKQAKRTHLL